MVSTTYMDPLYTTVVLPNRGHRRPVTLILSREVIIFGSINSLLGGLPQVLLVPYFQTLFNPLADQMT